MAARHLRLRNVCVTPLSRQCCWRDKGPMGAATDAGQLQARRGRNVSPNAALAACLRSSWAAGLEEATGVETEQIKQQKRARISASP